MGRVGASQSKSHTCASSNAHSLNNESQVQVKSHVKPDVMRCALSRLYSSDVFHISCIFSLDRWKNPDAVCDARTSDRDRRYNNIHRVAGGKKNFELAV